MKTFIPIVSILMLLICSCKHHELVLQPLKDRVWNDIDSLTNNSKDYTVCFLDSTWTSRTTNRADTNFIKSNLVKIDYDLSKFDFLDEQNFKHEFFLLDTLKNENSIIFVILLGKYHFTLEPKFLDQNHLFLLVLSGNKVITSYHLAETPITSSLIDDNIKTSVILHGGKIISRTIWHVCSDFGIDNIMRCTRSIKTDFNSYDPQVERFVPYKESTNKVEHYKFKLK